MAGSDAKARAIEETADQDFVISRVFDAAGTSVRSMDGAETPGALVGAAFDHESGLRDGCAAGRRLSHHNAGCQRGDLPDQRIFS